MPAQLKLRQTTLDSWYRLCIELTEVEPPVWREIIVPARLALPKLHSVILTTMGWEGGHLHEFQFRDEAYGILDPDWAQDICSENRVKLRKALAGSKQFIYTYDFGDNWRHSVRVLEEFLPIPGIDRLRCLAGQNACPPEDVGGAGGYAYYLEAITDPEHEEHEMMVSWRGPGFDPHYFDIDATSHMLAEFKI